MIFFIIQCILASTKMIQTNGECSYVIGKEWLSLNGSKIRRDNALVTRPWKTRMLNFAWAETSDIRNRIRNGVEALSRSLGVLAWFKWVSIGTYTWCGDKFITFHNIILQHLSYGWWTFFLMSRKRSLVDLSAIGLSQFEGNVSPIPKQCCQIDHADFLTGTIHLSPFNFISSHRYRFSCNHYILSFDFNIYYFSIFII